MRVNQNKANDDYSIKLSDLIGFIDDMTNRHVVDHI